MIAAMPTEIETSKYKEIEMSRLTYALTISYSGMGDADSKIEKVIGKSCDGSGFGFGARDMSFYYRSKKDMLAARRRLYRAKAAGIPLPRYTTDVRAF